MPESANAMTPFERRLSSSSLRRNGGGAPVALPVGLAHHLVDAVAIRPLGGDVLDAGTAAMHPNRVVVLGAGLVEAPGNGVRVGDVLAVGDGDHPEMSVDRIEPQNYRNRPNFIDSKSALPLRCVHNPQWSGRSRISVALGVGHG